MELRDDEMVTSELRGMAVDHDLREDHDPPASHRWMFAAIVALDLLAIVAFVTYVVIPRLT